MLNTLFELIVCQKGGGQKYKYFSFNKVVFLGNKNAKNILLIFYIFYKYLSHYYFISTIQRRKTVQQVTNLTCYFLFKNI